MVTRSPIILRLRKFIKMNRLLSFCFSRSLKNSVLYKSRPVELYKNINKTNCCHHQEQLSIGLLHLRSQFSTKSFEVNTNIVKDVMLYKYENPKFYRILNFFAICQFLFWNYLANFAFTTMKDAPVDNDKIDESTSWYRKVNLGENKYKNAITGLCVILGYGIITAAWMFTLRSVRMLVLRKGGDTITVVTYGPFNRNRIMDVPIKCLSAQEARHSSKVLLPIKIKNKSLFYVLDMRGEFTNGRLFDQTAGLKRKL